MRELDRDQCIKKKNTVAMTNSAHQSKNFPNKNKNTTQHSHIGTHASRDNESGIDRKVCICNTKCNKDYFDERGWHGCRQWPP